MTPLSWLCTATYASRSAGPHRHFPPDTSTAVLSGRSGETEVPLPSNSPGSS